MEKETWVLVQDPILPRTKMKMSLEELEYFRGKLREFMENAPCCLLYLDGDKGLHIIGSNCPKEKCTKMMKLAVKAFEGDYGNVDYEDV